MQASTTRCWSWGSGRRTALTTGLSKTRGAPPGARYATAHHATPPPFAMRGRLASPVSCRPHAFFYFFRENSLSPFPSFSFILRWCWWWGDRRPPKQHLRYASAWLWLASPLRVCSCVQHRVPFQAGYVRMMRGFVDVFGEQNGLRGMNVLPVYPTVAKGPAVPLPPRTPPHPSPRPKNWCGNCGSSCVYECESIQMKCASQTTHGSPVTCNCQDPNKPCDHALAEADVGSA